MLLTLDRFVREFCVRKKDQLTNPPVHDLKNFTLPRNAQLHFTEQEADGSVGILANNPMIQYNDKGKVVSEFIIGYKNDKAGGFKKVTKDPKEQIREYFRVNKTIVNGMHSKSATLLDKNLVVTNYGLMETGITYFNNQYAWWNRFQNRWATIFETVVEAVKSNRREHFIVIDIPNIFPSIAQLKRFAQGDDNEIVRKIANSERMIIAQFWNWFNQEAKSLVPRDPRILERMYFVFRFHDKWMVVNPNLLRSFVKTSDNSRGSFTEIQMQKKFLVMLLTMIYGSVDNMMFDDLDDVSDNPSVVPEEEHIEARRETIDHTVNHQSNFGGDDPTIKSELAKVFDKVIIETEEKDEFAEIQAKRDKKIDKLLDSLEDVNINVVEATEEIDAPEQSLVKNDEGEMINADASKPAVVIDYKGYSPKAINHEEMFKDKLKAHVLKGAITPQQMRRLEKMASKYKELPDPLTGTGSLEKAAVIDPQDLVVSKDKKFIDNINMVADESMLKSTLLEFDKKYINEVMQKDIYNSVLAVQRRGVAVQNYQIKRVKKLGDEYDVHSIKLVPVEGEPSTINFKVPVVDDFGVFQSRSVRNFMKKQRTDKK